MIKNSVYLHNLKYYLHLIMQYESAV